MHGSIGQKLIAARKARGLSLPDVAHVTKIPVARLQLLENDNLAAFGSMAYARSFLKLYSRFLGVDASDVLEGLPTPVLGGARDYKYLTDHLGDWVPEPREGRRGARMRAPSVRPKAGPRSPVLPTLGVFFVLLIAAGWWAGQLVQGRGTVASASAPLSGAEADTAKGTPIEGLPESASNLKDRGSVAPDPNLIDGLPAVTLKAIVVDPAGVPATPGPNTPVRRAEVVE